MFKYHIATCIGELRINESYSCFRKSKHTVCIVRLRSQSVVIIKELYSTAVTCISAENE